MTERLVAELRTLWPAKKAAAGWDGLAVPGTLELPSPPPPPPPLVELQGPSTR